MGKEGLFAEKTPTTANTLGPERIWSPTACDIFKYILFKENISIMILIL